MSNRPEDSWEHYRPRPPGESARIGVLVLAIILLCALIVMFASSAPQWFANPIPTNTDAQSTLQQITVPCPETCEEARSLRLNSVQSAQCPGLDRDGDGRACYGN
jgi:hypothetical protein